MQIKFYAEHKAGEAEESWPADVKGLPNVQEQYTGWGVSNDIRMTAVYGW